MIQDSLGAFGLVGKRAIVTGSESGLGRAIAAAFVSAGANVVGADITVERGSNVAASEAGHHRVHLDIQNRESVRETVAKSVDLLGGLDICVNCAGIGGRSPADSYPDDLWDRVIATNLTGTFAMCREVAIPMGETGSGSIVNIASIGGLVGYPGSVGYQSSKGAVVQMTRTLAVEWGPRQIRVNAVAPGHVATELVKKQWLTEPELRDFFLSRTPLNRLALPEDIANAVLFLASDAASSITGQTVAVDGGYSSQ
jgi:meso-butanediol dehydrogenase/(S,S)-butanediol dehydrogenase/diacetyl reductase